MDFLKLIDSIFESIPTDESNGESRYFLLLFVFNQLKRIDFTMTDLDDKITNHIAAKFTSKYASSHLDNIQQMFVFMDVRQAAGMVLDKTKKKVETPKFETAAPKPVADKVAPQDNYDPEQDVLEEEGLLEPPPKRGVILDVEFLKTLGITPDE